MHTYASSRVMKERAFVEKVNFRCFCWFPVAILVHQICTPIWRLHTRLYKGAWNVLANYSETVGHKDLRLGKIVYILVFYNISFSWLLPLDGLQFIFLLRVTLVISSGALISRSLSVSFKLRQKTGICLGCDCLKSRALLSDSFLELATLAMMLHP